MRNCSQLVNFSVGLLISFGAVACSSSSSSGTGGMGALGGAGAGLGGAGGGSNLPPLVTPVHVMAGANPALADGTLALPFATPYDATIAIDARPAWVGEIIIHEGLYELPANPDKTNRHANDVVVPASAKLQVLPGATFALGDKVSFHVQNDVSLVGTAASPIIFTWLTDKKHWGSFTNFEPTSKNNVFEYVIFEHGGESSFKGATTTGTLAIRGGGAHVNHCEFRFAEGDDGMNSSGAYILLENSYFHDNLNDCYDANKPSMPPGEARYNRFVHCGNDSIDAGEGSNLYAHHNTMTGSGDKGVSIGEISFPTIENNLIVGCNIGIGIKDGSDPVITNNTLVGNIVGVSNYEAVAGDGPGKGTFKNGIIWGSMQADIVNNENAGTTVFSYSCIQSSTYRTDLVVGSTPLPITGVGILTAAAGCPDPGFAAPNPIPPPAAMLGTTFDPGDYHLKSVSGRFDPLTMAFVTTDTTTSPCVDAGDPASPFALETLPNGMRIDLGAYGNTPEASKSAH